MENYGITMAAAKFVYKQIVERHKRGEDTSNLDVLNIIEEHNLWLSDEWTHVGFIILCCLENQKMVESFKKGNIKLLDSLLGKTIKLSNMTVDPELVRELLPLIIKTYF